MIFDQPLKPPSQEWCRHQCEPSFETCQRNIREGRLAQTRRKAQGSAKSFVINCLQNPEPIVEFVTSFSSTPGHWNSKKGILSKELIQSLVYTHILSV